MNTPDTVEAFEQQWKEYMGNPSKGECPMSIADFARKLQAERDKARGSYLAIQEEHIAVVHERDTLRTQLAESNQKVERLSAAYQSCNQDWQNVTNQLAEAKADVERLDWLENNHVNIYRFLTGAKLHTYNADGSRAEYFIDTSSVRDAVDAAMKKGKE